MRTYMTKGGSGNCQQQTSTMKCAIDMVNVKENAGLDSVGGKLPLALDPASIRQIRLPYSSRLSRPRFRYLSNKALLRY